MQFKGKIMNQTGENGNKPNFGLDFGPFGPNLGPQIFFMGFTGMIYYTLSQAIIVCNFKENL